MNLPMPWQAIVIGQGSFHVHSNLPSSLRTPLKRTSIFSGFPLITYKIKRKQRVTPKSKLVKSPMGHPDSCQGLGFPLRVSSGLPFPVVPLRVVAMSFLDKVHPMFAFCSFHV